MVKRKLTLLRLIAMKLRACVNETSRKLSILSGSRSNESKALQSGRPTVQLAHLQTHEMGNHFLRSRITE